MPTKRLFAVLALALLSTSFLCAGSLENVAPQRGRFAAAITWTDDAGRVRKLSDFAGHPIILLPIYTRCQSACIANVAQLKKALASSTTEAGEFRVLLFSFDATDTPAVLADYRKRENVPLAWFVGGAAPLDIDALMESIGFQYGKAGTEFMHPNLVVLLDSNLRVANWIYGNNYSDRQIDTALKVASGHGDWIGQHSDALYAILLFAASLLCVALFHHLRQRRIDPNNADWRNQAHSS
jgi:cytochrome oxidase Cu insertion factor (SCO1/SenC/PrrC family)